MMFRTPSRSARGFTLIEVMVAMAIVGVLASVAIPNFQLLALRSKVAERRVVMRSILMGIEDLYRRNGQVTLDGPANPPTPTVQKQVIDRTPPDWSKLLSSIEIDGAVYYSYSFAAWEAPAPGATIYAKGDLDGDGVPSEKWFLCLRTDGQYACTETPAEGSEDQSVF
jgi:type IV pilus assembly protein PilA